MLKMAPLLLPLDQGERFLVEEKEETLLTKPPSRERRGQVLEVVF